MHYSRLIGFFLSLLFSLSLQADTPYVPEEGSSELISKKKKIKIPYDKNLPSVLIIGDSISIGYTPYVQRSLKGKANVIHAPGNNQGTSLGIQKLSAWIGKKKWDVIHFNWGLHDLKHVTKAGVGGKNSNDVNDPQQADLETYIANMVKLVAQLKATGSKLIFATTTPYPAGVSPARAPENASKYNEAAIKIMTKNGISVNDLYTAILPHLNKLQKPKNVHFKAEGSLFLGNKVTAQILKLLK